MSDGWETIERPPLPEPHDVREAPLVGVYVESYDILTNDKFGEPGTKKTTTVHVFHFGNEAGPLVSLWGKPDLDGKISQLKPGDVVRVTYDGMEDLEGGKKLSKFTVQRASGATSSTATGTDDDIPF